MKTVIFLLSILFGTFPACVLAKTPSPRPAYLPSTPPAQKPISTYSAADVFGITITDPDQLPDGHLYATGGKFGSALRTDWPGAKVSTSIDELAQIVLDAPAIIEIRGREVGGAWNDLDDAWGNFSYILRKVMDISEIEKIDALVRIVSAQTDPMKKSRATKFAASMFSEFLDPRLLAYDKNCLDDSSVISILLREERPSIEFSARGEARRTILVELSTLGFTFDTSPFGTANEAANCTALKTWLTDNWAQIIIKCDEAKARPGRKLPSVNVRVYEPKW